MSGEQSDHDGDGLSTFCENNLAAAFAPELYYSSGDEVGREPYWAAKPATPGVGDVVTIAYLIAYYRDAGSSAGVCWNTPVHDSSCYGHNGDTETIFLDVYYDEASKHWVLRTARYSQHESYGVYSRLNKKYPLFLSYPSHQGAYPRTYVSEGKHANYATASECNAGGTLNADTCEGVDTAARLFVSAAYNLGSNSSRLLDCVESRDPSYIYYGTGTQECFWTGTFFRGWIPDSIGGPATAPYIDRLTYGGF